MIITPRTKFICDGQEMECSLIVNETGEVLPSVIQVDTKTGEVISYILGHNGKPMMLLDGSNTFMTSKKRHKQIYFTITAGPSEQVVQNIIDEAPVALKEN